MPHDSVVFSPAHRTSFSTRITAAIVVFFAAVVGVVETGLFVNMAERAYFGQPDGTVTSRTVPASVVNGHVLVT